MVKRVGIAQLRFAEAPQVLCAVGLGSCVGVALWSRERKIGGLAHVMLPKQDSEIVTTNPFKYADRAVEHLVRELTRRGCVRDELVAKMAGGATMFATLEREAVGARNVDAVREALRGMGVRLVAEDVGSDHGRTVELHTADGRLRVSSRRTGERWL